MGKGLLRVYACGKGIAEGGMRGLWRVYDVLIIVLLREVSMRE